MLKNGPFHGCSIATKAFQIFLPSQPETLERWNLPRLCISMNKFFRISFLAEFWKNFRICYKTVTYVVRYLALHHWSNFCRSHTSFGGVILEKPHRSSQKLYFLLLRKHLKVYDLTTRNGIMMKLTSIMYLNDTFHLVKNWGVTQRV